MVSAWSAPKLDDVEDGDEGEEVEGKDERSGQDHQIQNPLPLHPAPSSNYQH